MNPLTIKLSTLSPKQVSQIYRNVFGTIDGQLVLEDLRMRGFQYTSTVSHKDGSVDANATLINEGCRQMILTIETQMLPDLEKEK